jgi:protein involved in polysaccharide export with SLBB domain
MNRSLSLASPLPARAAVCWVLGWLVLLLAQPGPALAQNGPTRLAGETVAKDIRPGDIIRLRIWREPDLSGDFQVSENALVVLPRLGSTDVSRETSASLERRLVDTYAEFLQHTAIEVTILRRVQILGAVRTPGLYPIDPTMTLSDALALAGGVTPQGNPSRIELVRRGRRMAVEIGQHTRIADSPMESGDQIFVPERSWVSRNPGVVAAALTASVSLVIALIR